MAEQPDWGKIRNEFPTLSRKIYLNSCSLGLLSNSCKEALHRFIDSWDNHGAAAWYTDWMAEIASVRQQFASLINASPSEIAILPNISSTLAAISSSLDLGPGNQVVTTALDFPTVAHHFLAKERLGVKTTIIQSADRIKIDPDQFERAISPDTALVVTSHVYYSSGYAQDVGPIVDMAHQNGALAMIDDYQSTGQMPINVKELDIDILVSGGMKWLLGGPGIAFMYVKEDLVENLSPTVTGWFANRDQFDFNPNEIVFRDDAGRFETGTPPVASIFAGAEGLRFVNEIGPQAIRERTKAITGRLVGRLKDEGFKLRAPDDLDHHASITMVEMKDPALAVQELAKRDIIVDNRPGAVRFSPYFYNSFDDIDTAVSALCEIREALEL
jgi:selenocysteine lyase/cysteine desulfurase